MNFKSFCCGALFLPALLSANSVEKANNELEKSGLKYCPASVEAKASGIKFSNLPTGAKDFEVMLPAPKNDIVVNAVDFGLNERITNSATVINKAIEHCKKIGAGKLVINKGTYKCFDAVSVKFDGMKDFVVDFNNATLIYYSKSIKSKDPQPQWDANPATTNCDISITNCERMKICNLKLDWDWQNDPLAAFTRVVGKDANAKRAYLDLLFFQYERYPMYKKRAPILTIDPFYDDLSSFRTGLVNGWFGMPKLGLGEGVDVLDHEWLSPNKLRIYPQRKLVQEIPLNSTYRLMHYYYGKNGIDMFANKHLTLENIDILSCRGHALHVDGEQQYWQYINVNVAPPKDDARRACSSSADHHHIANSKGFVKLINCTFSMGMDDGGNFHDRAFIMKKAGGNILESANIRGIKYFSPKVDEEIELFQDNYIPTNFKAKITRVDGERIILDKPLPKQDGSGFVCFKTKYETRNIIIKDCKYIRHTRRGILMLAKDVTIENTLFEREEGGALKFETGYTNRVWCEGYGVDNVVVRNCTFRKTNLIGRQSQKFVYDIMLAAYMRTDPSDEQPAVSIIKNLLFENNKFYDTHGLVAVISSTDNIIFRNNVIENKSDYVNALWYRGGFCVKNSKNVYIIDNIYIESKKVPLAGIYYQRESVENLVAHGNKIVSEK